MIRESKELQIGKAGEYLVCADLIIKGFVAFPSEQGLPYDVLLDTGKRLLKIQVKTTQEPRLVPQRNKDTICYIFNVKRAGKKKATRYTLSEIDLFALVCLDTGKVGYLANSEMPETINIRVDSLKGSYYDEKGVQSFQIVQNLKTQGMKQGEIAKKTGLHASQVSRYYKDDYKPFSSNARYFSDFVRSKDWFYEF